MIRIKKSIVSNSIGAILLFLFIFPFKLYILPANNLHLIFIASIIYYLSRAISDKYFITSIRRTYVVFLFLISLLALWSFLSFYFNGNDLVIIKLLAIFSVAYISISYYISNVFFKDFDVIDTIKMVVYVIFAQALIALAIFFSQDIKEFYFHVIDLENDLNLVESHSSFRLIGLGTIFFGMGAVLSYGLIMISWLILNANMTKKENTIFSFIFIIIMIASLLSARTALFGVLISFIYLSLSLKGVKFLSKTILILMIGSLLVYLSIPANILAILEESVFPWAFEIFYNYSNNSSVETESSNQLINMYFNIPNISTWIVGDGYMGDPKGEGYYMKTDAGYMRQIFNYGAIGLIISILIYSYVLKTLIRRNNSLKVFSFITILFILILNIKGLMFFYSAIDKILIFILVCTMNKKSITIIQNK